jgi:hypothetical protein
VNTAARRFADGDIHELGYDLIGDTAGGDLDATSDELRQLEVAEPGITRPLLETVLAAAAT